MVYDPLKPMATDNLNVSQGDIQGNFATANTVFDINHYPFDNVTANKGKHKFVSMPNTTIPGTLANEGAIYTKNNIGTGNQSQMFFTSNAGGQEYQLTRAYDAFSGSFGASQGWTFLPGNLIMQYGVKNNPGTSGIIIFANTGFQFPQNIISVFVSVFQIGQTGVARVVNAYDVSAFNYAITSADANTQLFWWALGN
jgi:hypothetical protein